MRYGNQNKTNMNSIFQAFKIDKNDWKPLLAAALVGILAYSIFIFHHLIHNHEPFLPWIPVAEQMHNGRWFNRILFWINYQADIPVFGPLLGLAFAILSSYYATKLFYPLASKLTLFLAISITVCYPAVMAPFYYTWTTPVSLISWLLAVVPVLLVRQRGVLPLAIGAISLVLMLITNQGALSIFATVFVASCISMLVATALTKTESDSVLISKLIATGAKMLFIVLTAGFIYLIQAKISGGGIKAGNSEMISLSNIGELWPQVIRAAFNHLLITQPDILNPIKTILLIVVVSAVLASFFSCRKKYVSIFALIILWPILICAVKAVYFVVKPEFSIYEYRANLGMAFMYGFCFYIILITINEIKILRVLYTVLAFFVLTRFVQADLVRQSVLMRGQMHDLALANRILSRIESLPNIEDGKVYNFIRIGSYPWYRWAKLSPSWINGPNESGEAHMDTGFIPDKYTSHSVFQLLGSMIKLKFDDYQSGYKGESYARENLIKDRKPYPHDSSVFLIGDTIYVYLKDHPNF